MAGQLLQATPQITAPQGAFPARVSVVIPCYNTSRFLAEAIESVIGQTRSDWELVVVDDGSTDNSAEVAQTFADADPRIRVIRQPNAGLAGARKSGVSNTHASSEYLMFLDADDVLEPEMLNTLVSHLDRSPHASIAHCRPTYIDEESRPVQLTRPRINPRFIPTRFWMRALQDDEVETPFACIFCSAPFVSSLAVIRRSYYEQTKGWDESIGTLTEDVELFLDLALLSNIHFVPVPLVRYRVHASQSTVSDPEHFTNQVRRLYERWASYSDRPPHEQDAITAAFRFKHRRFDVQRGFRNARNEWEHGRYALATRAILGSFRNALRSFCVDP